MGQLRIKCKQTNIKSDTVPRRIIIENAFE